MKQTGRKIYRTMQGKQIDMDLLRKRNELTPAVGNVRVNARGDVLGPGGKIVKRHEDLVKEYYDSHPQTVVDETPVTRAKQEKVEDTSTKMTKSTSSKKTTRAQEAIETESVSDVEWVEDEDGNFIPKEG